MRVGSASINEKLLSSINAPHPIELRNARRKTRVRILLSLCLLLAASLTYAFIEWRRQLPLYTRWHWAENRLPQHHPSHLFHGQNRHPRYLSFARTSRDYEGGFGNIMQETLLNAYLAHKTGRGYVFDPFFWTDPTDSEGNSSLVHEKVPSIYIPMSAVISGVAVGAPMPSGSQYSPRAVNREHFDQICPPSERVVLKGEDVLPGVSSPTAAELVEAWSLKLDQISARCVEIGKWVFDWGVFTHADRLLPLWGDFRSSPVMTTLDYSSLVYSALKRNRHVFKHHDYFSHRTSFQQGIPGLLVLHLRRGDFISHCSGFLPSRRSEFQTYSAFPDFPDQFTTPSWQAPQEVVKSLYLKRCWPTIEEIIEHVESVRRDNPSLRSIYVMTNAHRDWLDELTEKLREQYPWNHINTSRNLVLTEEQQYIGQVVDMAIAERAQVFIGNGFSSLTSNINMRRMAKGMSARSNRFW